MSNLKYCVIGAGGTGGSLGAYLAASGADVTLIARGAHLEAMRKNGMKVIRTNESEDLLVPVKACTMEEYNETPDVVFVCVKGYSLDSVYPFLERVASKETVVIPILNIYGTGGVMQMRLPHNLVTDGCIYIAAEIKEPGVILKKGEIFRVVFGTRNPEEYRPVLETVRDDLSAAGITGILSDCIARDALAKFSYVSPAASCGLFYDCCAGEMQKPGEIRETFALLMHEIDYLAYCMGIRFKSDIVQDNLAILDALAPEASCSMQRDIWAGKPSEIDGLLYSVVRLGDQYGASIPTYRKIAAEAERRGLK